MGRRNARFRWSSQQSSCRRLFSYSDSPQQACGRQRTWQEPSGARQLCRQAANCRCFMAAAGTAQGGFGTHSRCVENACLKPNRPNSMLAAGGRLEIELLVVAAASQSPRLSARASAAKRYVQSQRLGHRGFRPSRSVGLFGAVGVNDLDVIAFVARHHLIARHAVGHGVHDRPLRRRRLPAPLSLGSAAIPPRRPGRGPCSTGHRHEHPRPDDFARLANALERAAAETKVHRRLPLAARAAPTADEMSRRGGAADQKHPNVIVDRARAIVSPQRISCNVFSTGWPMRSMHAIRHQAIEPGAFVDFVEMRQRLAVVQHAAAVAAA